MSKLKKSLESVRLKLRKVIVLCFYGDFAEAKNRWVQDCQFCVNYSIGYNCRGCPLYTCKGCAQQEWYISIYSKIKAKDRSVIGDLECLESLAIEAISKSNWSYLWDRILRRPYQEVKLND